MFESSSFFLSLFFLSIALPLTLQQQENPLYHFCRNDRGNFTANSTYSSNLDRLSSAVSSAAPSPGGFYNISIGQLNSISLCRGDVSAAVPCRDCITNATAELRRRCPNQKEAVIWYDSCMVRYSNRSIYSTQENGPMFYMWNVNNVTSTSVQNFNQVLNDLLDQLRTRAAGGGSTLKFAAGMSPVANFQRIYALVQCTPDLSELQCSSCLSQSFGQIPSCCNGKIGGRTVGPSCNFRYETEPFYDPSADAPSSSPPPPQPRTGDAAPPPLNGSTGGSGGQGGSGNSSRTVGIAVGISSAAILILSAGIFTIIRLRKPKQRVETVDDGIGSSDASQYDFETIKAATDDFALANKLGQGGFGPVYKVLNDLLDQLRTRVARGGSTLKFAAGRSPVANF